MTPRPSHDTGTSAPQRRRGGIAAVVAVAAFGVAVPLGIGLGAARSGANASDTEELGVNRLGAATLDLEVRTIDAPQETSAALRARNLASGDTVAGELTIKNVGSLPLRYSVSARTDGGALAAWLLFDVWSGTRACEGGPSGSDEILRTNLLMTASQVAVVGNSATGRHDGDRLLEPGTSERLCIRASLPMTAPNEAQGTQLGFDLTISAEHDAGESVPARRQAAATESGR
jgi:hypothetical protein